MALVGNKADLFEEEQVHEEEGEKYAKDIGAIFKITSAVSGNGIEALFYAIGCKMLNLKEEEEENKEKNNKDDEDKPVRLDSNKLKKKKGKSHCCV